MSVPLLVPLGDGLVVALDAVSAVQFEWPPGGRRSEPASAEVTFPGLPNRTRLSGLQAVRLLRAIEHLSGRGVLQ